MIFVTGRDRINYIERMTQGAASLAKEASLEREIARLDRALDQLREEWTYERDRADRATDALLASTGKPTVQPLPPETPSGLEDPYASEDPKAVAEVLKAMGITRA